LKAGEQPRQFSAYFLDINELQTAYNLATMTNDDDAMKRIGAKIKRTQDAPFAVIDDVGTRSSTEAFTSYVHAIINHRTSNAMPTVFTSNLPIEEMADVFTQRLYDRMRDQCGVIHFAGTSKRGRREYDERIRQTRRQRKHRRQCNGRRLRGKARPGRHDTAPL